ncbi:hypothetical protein ACQY0O_003628 [Thecaphora frezii]
MSSPRQQQQDEQPLLHGSEHHDTDSRFAIDDSISHDAADLDPDLDPDANGVPKYPPLPPSYDDTMRVDSIFSRSRWNPASWFTLSRTTREHIQACMPRSSPDHPGISASLASGFRRLMHCWPSNRFAQASIFIFGLWIIVIFTGPSLYDTAPSHAAPAVHQNWNYNDLPESRPSPVKGDGEITEEAVWNSLGCSPQIEPFKRVVCTETTSFLLDPNKARNSFGTTNSIFVDIDPSRADRPEPAGSVPGMIQFLHEDFPGSQQGDSKGKVKVEITAKYDQDFKFLFDKSLVAKTKRGFFDEGVEILVSVYRCPSDLCPLEICSSENVQAQRSTYRCGYQTYAKAGSEDRSPLVYDVKVRIPKGINVPQMFCEAGASNIEALFEQDDAAPATSTGRESNKQRARQGLLRRDAPWEGSFYFGKFHAKTQLGYLTASNIHALADIQMNAVNGNIKVRGKLVSRRVEIRSANGHITLDPDALVEAALDVLMHTSNGRISLDKNSSVKATTLRLETSNGPIAAPEATLHANHTVSLHSDNGRIDVAVAVHKADLSVLDGPGLEATDVVSVEALSSTGPIKLDFKHHEADVPLHSKAVSELAKVEVYHHKAFQGSWDLRGATQSKLRGPGTKEGVSEDGRKKRFVVDSDNFGWINRHAKGRIWWQKEGETGQPPAGARSQLATQLGVALAYFN